VSVANKHPILKMPLDLSQGVDEEVYKIVSSFKSGVDAKNFLCSAILYYARSPLVLSANALEDRLVELTATLNKFDFSYTGLQLEKILSKLEQVSVVSSGSDQGLKPTVTLATMDSGTANVLSSLKEKFKV